MPLFGGHGGGHRKKFLKTGEYFYTEKVRKKTRFLSKSGLFGGDKRDRTADLLNAMEERVHNYEYLCTKWSK